MCDRIIKQLSGACLDLVKSEKIRRELKEENEHLLEGTKSLIKDNQRLRSNIKHLLSIRR